MCLFFCKNIKTGTKFYLNCKIQQFYLKDDDIKRNMKSMRDTYLRTLKEMKKSGSGREALSEKKKHLLSMCSFLRPFVKPRGGISSLPSEGEEYKVNKYMFSKK